MATYIMNDIVIDSRRKLIVEKSSERIRETEEG
jgi:hypothetical protein